MIIPIIFPLLCRCKFIKLSHVNIDINRRLKGQGRTGCRDWGLWSFWVVKFFVICGGRNWGRREERVIGIFLFFCSWHCWPESLLPMRWNDFGNDCLLLFALFSSIFISIPHLVTVACLPVSILSLSHFFASSHNLF